MTNVVTLRARLRRDTPLVILFLSFWSGSLAQESVLLRTAIPSSIESSGSHLKKQPVESFEAAIESQDALNELPLARIQKLSGERSAETASSNRSARDAELYRVTAPSVVRIMTNSGSGSGSLIGNSGEILTNFHVVKGQAQVAVVFKPVTEGAIATRDDLKLGQVIKYDEVTDLALVRVTDIPKGKIPIRLGDLSEAAIGADVSAIGHPDDQAWTFTKGLSANTELVSNG